MTPRTGTLAGTHQARMSVAPVPLSLRVPAMTTIVEMTTGRVVVDGVAAALRNPSVTGRTQPRSEHGPGRTSLMTMGTTLVARGAAAQAGTKTAMRAGNDAVIARVHGEPNLAHQSALA